MLLGSAAREITVPPGGPTCFQVCALADTPKRERAANPNASCFIATILPNRIRTHKMRILSKFRDGGEQGMLFAWPDWGQATVSPSTVWRSKVRHKVASYMYATSFPLMGSTR